MGMLTVDKDKTTFYAINPTEFPSTRLELETNIMTLKEDSFFKYKKDEIAVSAVKLSFNELQKFRANLDIMETFHKMNSFDFSIDISTLASKGDQGENIPGTYIAQKIYFHENTSFILLNYSTNKKRCKIFKKHCFALQKVI